MVIEAQFTANTYHLFPVTMVAMMPKLVLLFSMLPFMMIVRAAPPVPPLPFRTHRQGVGCRDKVQRIPWYVFSPIKLPSIELDIRHGTHITPTGTASPTSSGQVTSARPYA